MTYVDPFTRDCLTHMDISFSLMRTFLPEKWRTWVRVCRAHQRLKSAILISCLYSFVDMLVFFLLSAFAHKKMKAGRRIYDYDDVSVTIARPTRSKSSYKKARKGIVLTDMGEIKLNKARRFFLLAR